MRPLAFFLLVFLFFSCASKKEEIKPLSWEKATSYNKKIIKYSYKVKPGDRISILFYRHPELSTKDLKKGILVKDDGSIILPLVGKVNVSDLTTEEIQSILKEKYSLYIKNPHLYVEVVNKRVYVLGEVKKPGIVPLFKDRITLVEALAEAGDITDYGKKKEIYILKGGLKNPQILRVDISDSKNLLFSNIYLQPEDIVYVPPNKTKNMNLAINGALPLINLIGGILSSFVDIKYLSQ